MVDSITLTYADLLSFVGPTGNKKHLLKRELSKVNYVAEELVWSSDQKKKINIAHII